MQQVCVLSSKYIKSNGCVCFFFSAVFFPFVLKKNLLFIAPKSSLSFLCVFIIFLFADFRDVMMMMLSQEKIVIGGINNYFFSCIHLLPIAFLLELESQVLVGRSFVVSIYLNVIKYLH